MGGKLEQKFDGPYEVIQVSSNAGLSSRRQRSSRRRRRSRQRKSSRKTRQEERGCQSEDEAGGTRLPAGRRERTAGTWSPADGQRRPAPEQQRWQRSPPAVPEREAEHQQSEVQEQMAERLQPTGLERRKTSLERSGHEGRHRRGRWNGRGGRTTPEEEQTSQADERSTGATYYETDLLSMLFNSYISTITIHALQLYLNSLVLPVPI